LKLVGDPSQPLTYPCSFTLTSAGSSAAFTCCSSVRRRFRTITMLLNAGSTRRGKRAAGSKLAACSHWVGTLQRFIAVTAPIAVRILALRTLATATPSAPLHGTSQ